ncbi:leucyl aminopeptidase [Pseudomonas putida]|nr:leucyl aminopeptidase [Pseudomonas putida]
MNVTLVCYEDEAALRTADVDCIVVGVHGKQLSETARMVDDLCRGSLGEAVDCGDLADTVGNVLFMHTAGGLRARRILLVQLGVAEKCTAKNFCKAALAAAKAIHTGHCQRVLWALAAPAGAVSAVVAQEHSVQALSEAGYRFDRFKSASAKVAAYLQDVQLHTPRTLYGECQLNLRNSQAIAAGVSLCRELGNLPPNICTPQYLADTAHALATSAAVDVEILEQQQIEALQMNSFLSVARGSTQPPKLIVIKYNGAPPDQAPVVLVGKGITFDSGGISIKPGEAMDEMKYDMCGAASVIGTLQAVIAMELPLNVYGVIPACENMPAGDAVKPGDIITSMQGKTIEVLNTDAEGRLILCDALTYVERFEPRAVIDIATLTGACVIALGQVHSGLFAREEVLAAQLMAAAHASTDSVWRMPMDEAYQEQLKSNFADLQNIGGRPGGSITAACFLENFTRKYPWAHLDIAGTAWKSGAEKGATGRPVKLLTRFLIDQAESLSCT